MVEAAVASAYSVFSYSLRSLPQALVLAAGLLSSGVAVGNVLAGLLGVWFPI